MSDISQFLTTQVTPAGKPLQAGALAGTGTGVFASGSGINFLDLILTQIAASADENGAEKKNLETTLLESDNPVLTDIANIDLSEIPAEAATEVGAESLETGLTQEPLTAYQLALLPDDTVQIETDGSVVPADLAAIKAARIEKRLVVLDKLIAHFTNGAPQDVQEHPAIQLFVEKLEVRSHNLEAKLDALQNGEDIPFPALIALGLNPVQITKITERIHEVEEKLGRDLTVEDLIAGVANITPLPSEDTPVIIPPAGQPFANSASSLAQQASNQNAADTSFESRLNNLVIGENGNNGQTLAPRERLSNGIDVIEQLARQADTKAGAQQQNGQAAKDSFSALLNQSGSDGSIRLPTGWYQAFYDGIEWGSTDSLQSGLPLSNAVQAAHMTTQVQQAGQPHPATQMVAATLNKTAQNGDTRNITLHLDPPDLGRVEVRMEFGPDKSLKAHLLVEKPETFLMLQRDSAALERALQNSGLDAGGESLSFELAEDGSAFEHNNNGKGGGNGESDSDQAATSEEDIIQTTMTWYVDPETGHTRYNLVV